jgi:hypothetical protein
MTVQAWLGDKNSNGASHLRCALSALGCVIKK